MTPTYDKPLLLTVAIPGSPFDFASPTPANIPASIGSVKGPLRCAQVYGISGIVSKAGTGVLTIGTTDDPDRFGTFTVASGLAVGDALVGDLVLTEEGFHIGVSNEETQPEVITISAAAYGTITVNSLQVVVGYFY